MNFALDLADLIPALFKLAHCHARAPGKHSTHLRQCRATRMPLEQRHAKFFFEFANAAAKRRLGNAEVFGGCANAFFFHDSQKVAQVVELHHKFCGGRTRPEGT